VKPIFTKLPRITFAVLVVVALAPAIADQIVIGELSYPRARVVALEEGVVQFRLADGAERIAWLSDIDMLVVDSVAGFANFNEAEQYLNDGSPGKAIVRYERALRAGKGFWTDLIASRLVVACDRAGHIDRAALNFIRVARGRHTGVSAAARIIPCHCPENRDASVVRAIEHLDTAIVQSGNDVRSLLFRLLRYEVLRSCADRRTSAERIAVAGAPIPEELRCRRVYSIRLEAIKSLLQSGASSIDLTSVDRDIADCPESVLPGFLLLKGRALLETASTRQQVIRASWPLMRVAIHMPHSAEAAEALYYAARALERLGRPDKAIRLLKECLEHQGLDPATRRLALEVVTRLQPDRAESESNTQ